MAMKRDMARVSMSPLVVPHVPNYIATNYGGAIDVGRLNIDACKDIGRLWTKALIKNSKKRKEAIKAGPKR